MNVKELKAKAKTYTKEMSYSTMGDKVDEFVDDQLNTIENPIWFGFKKFDERFEGGLRGKVCARLGYGGSKKSLAALNLANYNAINKDGVFGLYSSMEMPAIEIISRELNYLLPPQMSVDGTRELPPSSYIFRDIKRGLEKEVREKLKNVFNEYVGKRILLTEGKRMTAEKYDKLLKRIGEEVGPLSFLIVDGLSMMDGHDNESKSASINTGELKDLANDHKIYIEIMTHCSRGADLFHKDLRQFARGSEKILDNVDFIISMSQYEGPDGEPLEGFGHMRLDNKRGRGGAIHQVYQFDPMSLKMLDCNRSPSEFDRGEENKPKSSKYGR